MKNLQTLGVHGIFNDQHGAVMPVTPLPLPAPGRHTGYEYSCFNPTAALKRTELESGRGLLLLQASRPFHGIVLELLDKDSHLVAVDDVYGGTYRLINVRRQAPVCK